jgi:leucyl aminopeptidase
MHLQPILKTAAVTPLSGQHLLVLTHPKKGVPEQLAKQLLPARYRDASEKTPPHPALAGERGAKLILNGERTVIVMGLGALNKFTAQEASEWGENAAHALIKEQAESVQVVFPDDLMDRDVLACFIKGLCLGNYRLDEFKSQKKPGRKLLRELSVSGKGVSRFSPADFERLQAVVDGISFARDLVELPSGTATPQGIVDRFRKAGASKGLQLEVWDEKKIAAKKMGLIQAVSQGSGVPPRFLVARYAAKGGKAKGAEKGAEKGIKTLYLVGKGVTFDTGGVNLKVVPWKELVGMKKDMGGAAAVLGAMLAISKLKPGINVVGVTPLTTNQLGSKAINPGDIFTSFSGKTVEIQNTDAEGRLILADALHFAVSEGATWIVDAATLTGACCIALGANHTGEFSNDDRFAKRVRDVAEASGEPTWPLPMSPRYGEELKSSELADLSNMGKSREAGATIGAKFLEYFVGETPWVHLDIAGTVDLGGPAASGAQVHAAGRMVHTFARLAEELS